jgi:hypothetical protein
MSKRINPLTIFIFGTLLSILIAGAAKLFGDWPQCPDGVSAEGNHCIIGANIGLGLAYMLAIGISVITYALTVISLFINLFKKYKKKS